MDWKTLERHPRSAEFNDISGKRWDRFLANLKKNKIVNGRKITMHEGKVFDGWQLYRGCLELDIKPEFQTVPNGIDPDEFIETLQDLRRHDTPEEEMKRAAKRREKVVELREEGNSIRAIAEQLDVSKATVQADLSGVQGCTPETNGKHDDPATPPKVTGTDGKSYPASKPPKVKILCESCKTKERKSQPLPKGCKDCKALQPPKKEKPTEPDVTPPDKPAPSPVDGWGIPIQEHAAEAFTAQPLFDELLTLLKKADKLYSEIADHEGGAYLKRPGISVNARDRWKHNGIKTAILNVTDCRPTYTVCPYGFNKHHEHTDECTLCHGLNWVRPLGKEEVAAEMIEGAKGAYGV